MRFQINQFTSLHCLLINGLHMNLSCFEYFTISLSQTCMQTKWCTASHSSERQVSSEIGKLGSLGHQVDEGKAAKMQDDSVESFTLIPLGGEIMSVR